MTKPSNLFLVAWFMFFTSFNLAAEVSVIVHPSNSTSMSTDDIKRIFLGKMKNYPDGSQAIPVNQVASSSVRDSFDSTALGKSPSQIKAYWSKLVFSGKGNPPKEVASDQEVIKLVKENAAMIGYVDSTNVGSEVKVIAKF